MHPTVPSLRRISTLVLGTALAVLLAVTASWADAASVPPATRVAGPDRYATATALASEVFAPGVDRVYVATGDTFPDALTVGPVAGTRGAPILLTTRDTLPATTIAELDRLDPGAITVVGGAAAVSDAVFEQLAAHTDGAVTRISGPDRFATAAAVADDGFAPGVDTAFVATGLNFPDALAGGVLANAASGPILLTGTDTLPEATRAALARLGPGRIVVLGGPSAVSDGVTEALAELTDGDVERVSGSDRYATARAISEAAFPAGTDRLFLATGQNFPDALSSVPGAIESGAAVVLTRTDCAPEATRAEVARLGVMDMLVLGGTAAVTDAAAELTACEDGEIPAPTFTVDPDVTPTHEADGRPVASLVDEHGTQMDFVADELVVVASQAEVDALLAEVGGEVLEEVPFGDLDEEGRSLWRLRVTVPSGDGDVLAGLVRELDPRSRGGHRASSEEALGLLQLAAAGTVDGLPVGVNALADSTDVADRIVAEAPSGSITGYTPNPFDWTYLNSGSVQDIGVTEAWRALEFTGRANPSSRIPIAVLDQGCAFSNDLPPGSSGWNNARNGSNTGVSGWHCTHVAMTAAGLIDNGLQTAGTGGSVARVRMYPNSFSVFNAAGNIISAAASGIRITNMSFGGELPAGVGWTSAPLEIALVGARAVGVLHFAAAGNDRINVDATDCFIGCWEEALHWPCELATVVCIGGLETDSRGPAVSGPGSGSNTGNQSVDLWAPYRTYSGADPDNTANAARLISGTSFATPYVAGVAAMLEAAQPSLDAGDIESLLISTSRLGVGAARRYVQAGTAVFSRFGGNAPPFLDITTPSDGASRLTGPSFLARANASNPDGSTPTVRWRFAGASAGTGTSNNIETEGLGFGTRTLQASMVDGPYTLTDTISVVLTNDPPVVDLTSPQPGAVVQQSQSFILRATSRDGNFPPDSELPDANVRWFVDGGSTVIATGHQATITGGDLGPIGSHTIRVEGSDGTLTDTDEVTITVIGDSGNIPPTATIITPEQDDLFGVGQSVDFEGTGSDPEDGALSGAQLVWTQTGDRNGDGVVTAGETDVVIGTGTSFSAVLQHSAQCEGSWEHAITLSVTDTDGATSTDTITVDVLLIC